MKRPSVAASPGSALIVAAMALDGCASVPTAPNPPLDAPALRALFVDRTVTSRNLRSGTVSVSYYAPDGSVRQRRGDGQRTGRWQIRDDGRICLAMEGDAPKCRAVRRDPDGRYRKYAPGLLRDTAVIEYTAFADGDRLAGAATAHASPAVARPASAAPTPHAAAAPARARIAAVQQALREAGFDPGAIDGLWGPRSREAMRRYQVSRGLDPTGDADLTLAAGQRRR